MKALDLAQELTAPERLKELTTQVASNAMKAANVRKATATHFGVPEDQVDDQMIEMYESSMEAK